MKEQIQQKELTLTGLLIAVAIIGIITATATSNYLNPINRSRQNEAASTIFSNHVAPVLPL